MNKIDANFVIVGKIGSTYGIHGWLKIQTYTEFNETILDFSPWYLTNRNDEPQAMEIEDAKPHGKGIVVKLTSVNTPEAARLFTGKFIAIPREQLPSLPTNEYYWSDLIGLTVINKQGEILGKVIYLIETGSNDVLVVKGIKEFGIPYLLGKVVTAVDLEKKEIHVDWEIV